MATNGGVASGRTRTKHGCWVGVNLCVLCVLLVLSVLLDSGTFKPTIRGIYCGDDAISYPFKSDTVPNIVAIATTIAAPVVIIVCGLFINQVVDCGPPDVRSHHSTIVHCGPYYRQRIPPAVYQLLVQIYYYLLGYMIVGLFTGLGKVTVGRLRPYFLAVCKPNYTTFNCTDDHGFPAYILEPSCQGKENDVIQARLSWPSGHTAISVYAAVFIVLYLEATKMNKLASSLKVLIGAIAVTLAFLCSLSRITDHAHHWGDVLSGAILGAAVALYTVGSC
jgi:phosphatidate phosphatase